MLDLGLVLFHLLTRCLDQLGMQIMPIIGLAHLLGGECFGIVRCHSAEYIPCFHLMPLIHIGGNKPRQVLCELSRRPCWNAGNLSRTIFTLHLLWLVVRALGPYIAGFCPVQ